MEGLRVESHCEQLLDGVQKLTGFPLLPGSQSLQVLFFPLLKDYFGTAVYTRQSYESVAGQTMCLILVSLVMRNEVSCKNLWGRGLQSYTQLWGQD